MNYFIALQLNIKLYNHHNDHNKYAVHHEKGKKVNIQNYIPWYVSLKTKEFLNS